MTLSLPAPLALAAIALSVGALLSTTLGGLFAIRFRDRLPMIMGFTAGVVIGVVCFELLPEVIRQIGPGGPSPRAAMGAMAFGILLFHALEKLIIIHHHDECARGDHKHPRVGALSALALAGHSLMDGIGIGLGFQVSQAVGGLVAIAVIAHDFVDGMNTVAVVLNNRGTVRQALPFLALDALAPFLGAASTLFFRPPAAQLTLYLAFFAGFLLYIGAGHILPEAHSEKSSFKTLLLTLLGALFAFAVSAFA